jgi:hypothetical protein
MDLVGAVFCRERVRGWRLWRAAGVQGALRCAALRPGDDRHAPAPAHAHLMRCA